MAEENLNKGLINTFKSWFKKSEKSVLPVGSITEESRDELNKALEPKFLFKPPFGYPRNVNLLEVRRLAATPYVEMCISTIIDEIGAIEWDIVTKECEEGGGKDEQIEHIKKFFENPNTNKESFEKILRKVVRDILEVDSGIMIKQFNMKEEMVGIVAKDGATFNKNPDIYGMFTDREELMIGSEIVGDNKQSQNMQPGMIKTSEAREKAAYFQFGWVTGIRPIPFGKREVVWFERNPRTDNFYGRSPIEILAEAIQMLIYSIEDNLKYYNDNNVPKGVLGLEESDADSVKAFEDQWTQKMRERDAVGNWRRKPHHIPIINKKPTFTRIQFSNAELELIEQQKWFSKMVWASFGVTATELGYTEDAKGMANQIVQSQVFRKRAINPLLRMIEYNINKEIISEFEYGGIEFKFNTFDVEEETKKAGLYKAQLDTFKTVNEIRREEGLDEVEGGDEVKRAFSENTFNFGEDKPFNNPDKNKEPDKEEKALSTSGADALFPKEGEQLEVYLKKLMKKNERKIVELLEKEKGKDQISQLKSVQDVVKFVNQLLTFEGIKTLSDPAIEKLFTKGWDKSEDRLQRNLEMNKEALEILKKHTFENLKGMTEEIAEDLRQELERGFINAETIEQLKDRVKKVFDVGENRSMMIARTESNRAENQGQLQAMKKSGEKMTKTWLSANDDHTSPLCKRLNGKTVGLNEKFLDSQTKQEFDSPPAHVNCRSTMVYNFEDD